MYHDEAMLVLYMYSIIVDNISLFCNITNALLCHCDHTIKSHTLIVVLYGIVETEQPAHCLNNNSHILLQYDVTMYINK